MSINHIPSELGDTLRWAHQAPINMEHTHLNQPVRAHNNKPLNFNLNQTNETSGEVKDDEEEMAEQTTIYIQKESMFEKPLTPSDVGKLNRLVIPKQHAEKYFPLGGSDSVEKGLLLSFEDESGKTWRFRYSYWNSSQSYVLTKGWSRYVKEKRLDAGDVVVFERSREDCDRFFVGWRPRNAALPLQNTVAQSVGSGGGGGWSRVYYSNYPYPTTVNSNGQQQPAVTYQPHSHHAPTSGGRSGVMQNQTTTVVGNSKTLRLFGVNLECQSDADAAAAADDSNQSEHLASVHVSRQQSRRHMQQHQDINFSGDVNQMRFHQE